MANSDLRTEVAEAITQALCAAWPVEIGSDLVFAEQVGRIAADAVLAAVTPVIRRQVAEEIAADLETASGSLGWLPMRYDAAAIARSHSTQPTEEETTQ